MGTDTRLDSTTDKAIFHSEILAPLVHDGVVDAKEFLKGLKAALQEPATMTVAALCLLSTAGKVAHDNLAVEAVEGLFRSSFEDHKNSDGLVCFSALSSTHMFQAWAAATGVRRHFHRQRGRLRGAVAPLRARWRAIGHLPLEERVAAREICEAQRTGVRFVLPSRNALPSGAAHSGPITEDQVYIIALSYCWAGPGQPDPENKLLSDVCELLGYLDTSIVRPRS